MRVSYDLSPVHGSLRHPDLFGVVRTENTPAQGNSDQVRLTMHCDNAYLPRTNLFGVGLTAAQTQAACLAALSDPHRASTRSTTAAPRSSTTAQRIPFGSNWANILTDQNMHIFRQTRRFVVGGDGSSTCSARTGTGTTYFEHGETDTSVKIYNMPLSNTPVNPATGNAGYHACSRASTWRRTRWSMPPAISSAATPSPRPLAACPSIPSAPTINPASHAYFDNQNGPGRPASALSSIQTNRQESFSFALNGSPFGDWAGPVAVAAGYAYREEHYSQRSDPYAAGVTASTPATVNEPCTDPFVDCGLTSPGARWAPTTPVTTRTAAAPTT